MTLASLLGLSPEEVWSLPASRIMRHAEAAQWAEGLPLHGILKAEAHARYEREREAKEGRGKPQFKDRKIQQKYKQAEQKKEEKVPADRVRALREQLRAAGAKGTVQAKG